MKYVYAALLILSFSYAQAYTLQSTPDGDKNSLIHLRVSGTSVYVAMNSRGWFIAHDGHTPDEFHYTSKLPYIMNIRKGHPSDFIATWGEGGYKVYTVSIVQGRAQSVATDSGYVNIPNLISLYYSASIKGHDYLYTSARIGSRGFPAYKPAGSNQWQLDTIGAPQNYDLNDFDIDTSGVVYGMFKNRFFYSMRLYRHVPGQAWSAVTSLTDTLVSKSVIDNKNGIFISSYPHNLISHDNALSWDTIHFPAGANSITYDEGGAFYAINTSTGYAVYTATTTPVTWTNMDTSILALNPSRFSMQDSFFYAATNYGLYLSKDGGASWRSDVKGTGSAPTGYWRFGSGRQVAATGLGIYIKDASDTIWTKTFPLGSRYVVSGTIQGDTMGNIYTLYKDSVPMISTDQGASWQPDTAGIYQMSGVLTTYYVDESGGSHLGNYGNEIYYKPYGGSYTIDTNGLGSQPPFAFMTGGTLGFASDHAGMLYAFTITRRVIFN